METDKKPEGDTLASWITSKVNSWQDNRTTNFGSKWNAYERAWRTVWSPEDKSRESERSQIVTPALQQAVESAISEIEETVFGSPEIFDIQYDETKGIDGALIAQTKSNLRREIPYAKIRRAVSEALINGSVYGTGIIELVLESKEYTAPAMQEQGGAQYNGVVSAERTCVRWKSINPRNFVIDPTAASIEDGLGVAVVEYVGTHVVKKAQEDGVYDDTEEVGTYRADSTLETDQLAHAQYTDDRCKLVRYYGKVPSSVFYGKDEVVVDLLGKDVGEEKEANDGYIEAIIVIANDNIVLKKEENPYMMKHRPIVAFAWDHVPGRFWGRGVCEKGIQAQKALDAETRARLDSLAFVVWPMMAADATKLPRGFKLQVTPGKHILTQGPPSEALMQFKFGNLDPNHWQNFENLRQMVFEATGTNEAGGRVPDGAKTGAVSMSLSGMIKRTKRVLFNFYDEAFVPGLQKMAWMLMQYDPDRFPAQDFDFVPTTMMSVSAREYETAQLVQLLQTVGPETPAYPELVAGIIQNTSLHNREQIIQTLQAASQPDPKQQKMAEMVQELEIRERLARIAVAESQAGLNYARAEYESKYKPHIEMVNAMAEARPDEQGDRDFDKLVNIAEVAVKEKDIESNERITEMQTAAKLAGDASKEEIKALREELKELRKEQGEIAKKKRKSKREADGSIVTELID